MRPNEPSIDELGAKYAAAVLETVPRSPERAAAQRMYVVSLMAVIESEALVYPLPGTGAEQAQRLNALAVRGIYAAAEPYDREPSAYLFKKSAAWRRYLSRAITSQVQYAGESPRSWIDLLYRLEDGTAWFGR